MHLQVLIDFKEFELTNMKFGDLTKSQELALYFTGLFVEHKHLLLNRYLKFLRDKRRQLINLQLNRILTFALLPNNQLGEVIPLRSRDLLDQRLKVRHSFFLHHLHLYVKNLVDPHFVGEVHIDCVLVHALEAVLDDCIFELFVDDDDGEEGFEETSLGDVEEFGLEGHDEWLRQDEGAFDAHVIQEIEEFGVARVVDWEFLVFHYDMKLIINYPRASPA